MKILRRSVKCVCVFPCLTVLSGVIAHTLVVFDTRAFSAAGSDDQSRIMEVDASIDNISI